MAKKRSHKKRARSASGKFKKARSNPGHRAHARRSSRRRSRSNPSMRMPHLEVFNIDLVNVGLGVTGGLGTSMLVNAFAPKLPETFQSGWGKLGLKAGVVALAGLVLPKVVGKKATIEIVGGAAIIVAGDAVREFLAPKVPGLAGLMDSPFMDEAELSGYIDSNGLSGAVLPGGGPTAMMPGRTEGWKAPWEQ